jgi:hypothetical protein
MQLLSILGQYLLLSFVLPGFCYLLVFALCFPGVLGEIPAWLQMDSKKDGSQGLWISFLAVTGGLGLSSVAFAIELVFRHFVFFDCCWFPKIPFDEMMGEQSSLANFFTAESFMHFNIGVGIFLLLLIFLINVTLRSEWRKSRRTGTAVSSATDTAMSSATNEVIGRGRYLCDPMVLAVGLFVLVPANLKVSSHLFHRVAEVTYKNTANVEASVQKCKERHQNRRKTVSVSEIGPNWDSLAQRL